ncbi:Rieske 2Fe-2S domain-containing protein [Streptomyces chattanoogensis]|uniref:Rieske 2Fe-2S domain-containing protein n=1 Tax=Streptomyces chattanoogensis TaxID=66876 RepID=UPI00367D01E1
MFTHRPSLASGTSRLRSAGAGLDVSSLANSLDSLADARALDAVIAPLRKVVRTLPLGRYRDVLHGRQLGHPLHPALVQVPIGAWTSAALLDVVPGASRSARFLVGVGVVAAVPAALAGWVDWAEQHKRQMRTGVVHAAANAAAIGLYTGSWAARRRGQPWRGKALGLAGLTVATAGGVLGGHLAFRQGAGTNKAEPVPRLLEPGWQLLGRVDDLPVGEPVRREVGEVPVVVVRDESGEVHVLANRCSHLSGPLSEGKIIDGCVECPWHGSTFRLSDGQNVRGPATAPQPSFEVRTDSAGTLYVRLPEAG